MRKLFISLIAVTLVQMALPCLIAAPRAGYVIQWGVNLDIKDNKPLPAEKYFSTNTVMIDGKELVDVTAIAAGGAHGLALKSDGTVAAWGDNGGGSALGYDTSSNWTNGLVRIKGEILSDVTAIAASFRSGPDSFNIALKSDGTIVAWGGNRVGQTSIPSGLSNITAIAAGYLQGLALRKDGTVVSWGQGNPPPKGLSNVVAIAAGGESGRNVALLTEGTVVDWPVLSVDYSSTVPAGLSDVVTIASGSGQSLALKKDGTVFGWGANNDGSVTGVLPKEYVDYSYGPVMINNVVLSNVVKIAAGSGYSMALKKDGTVATWGRPIQMRNAVPAGLSNVVAISAGYEICLALTTNEAVAAKFRR